MKKFARAATRALGGIDLAFLEPFPQVLGRQVDVDDLVGLGEDGIRETLPDLDAHGALDHVVEALQVLDVEGRDDVDPGGQDVLDILVPFRVPASGDVGVGQLVDERDLGLAGQNGVHVHLFHGDAVILLAAPGNDFQPAGEFGDLRPAVRLEQSDDDVDPPALQPVAFLEHLVGLADPGAVAEIDLQPAVLASGGSSGGT